MLLESPFLLSELKYNQTLESRFKLGKVIEIGIIFERYKSLLIEIGLYIYWIYRASFCSLTLAGWKLFLDTLKVGNLKVGMVFVIILIQVATGPFYDCKLSAPP